MLGPSAKSWFPELRERMKETYESSTFIIENDGWRPDQLQTKEQITNPEMYRNANLDSAKSKIALLQKVFDIPDVPDDERATMERLKEIFEQCG